VAKYILWEKLEFAVELKLINGERKTRVPTSV
jgi:hypothetical protein